LNGTLLIYAPNLDKGELLWHYLGDGITAQQGSCNWQDNEAIAALSERSQEAYTIVILPGEQVRWFSVAMQSKQRALVASLPFQIEDQLSTPIEQMHVVPGHFKEGSHSVLAVEHSILANIIHALANHHIHANVISADYLLLSETQEATAYLHNQHVLIRSPAWSGRVHQSLFGLIKERLAQPINAEDPSQPSHAFSAKTVDDSALMTLLAKGVSPKRAPISLLTGPYEHQTLWQQWLAPYKQPLYALGALAIVGLSLLLTQNLALQQQVNQLDESMVRLYKETFPDARRITNPVAQFRGALRQSGQSGGEDAVLIWLSQVAPLLHQEKVTLLNLRFTQAPDTLRLQLQANDYGAIEKISSALAQQGLQADLGTLVRNDNHVSGLLTIKGS
jgi:general secretion pathway protein L